MGKKVLTTKSLAEEMGVHPLTIIRLLKKGLPYVDRGRKLGFEFDVEECKEWYKGFQKEVEEKYRKKKDNKS